MIGVLIVDAFAILRHGLRLILQEDPQIHIVAEADTCVDAVAKAALFQPNLILIDPHLPDNRPIEVIDRLRSEIPQANIIVLSGSENSHDILAAFQAGVKGYLSKNIHGTALIRSIHQVALGQTVLPPELTSCLLNGLSSPEPPSGEELTRREMDILECVTEGLGNREIASTLNISQNTVKTHVRRILCKLHLRSRTEAASYALRNGLLPRHR